MMAIDFYFRDWYEAIAPVVLSLVVVFFIMKCLFDYKGRSDKSLLTMVKQLSGLFCLLFLFLWLYLCSLFLSVLKCAALAKAWYWFCVFAIPLLGFAWLTLLIWDHLRLKAKLH